MSNQVQMPLLGQSVRMLHGKGLTKVKHAKDKKYRTLVTRYEGNTIIEEEIDQDYHITPEYVASFADSADYHNDVNGAIAKSKPRKNLGDIRDMQEVSRMDSDELNALAQRLKENNDRLMSLLEEKKQVATSQTATSQTAASQTAVSQVATSQPTQGGNVQ